MSASLLAIAKTRFITEVAQVSSKEESAINALNAALQHNRTYAPSCSLAKRYQFRAAVVTALVNFGDAYSQGVSTADHINNIVAFADSISISFGDSLVNGRFRIGTAQKALNLHVKTIWCMEPNYACPPHCPLDSYVLEPVGIDGRWTKLDSIEVYSQWISRVQAFALRVGHGSIAEWELLHWTDAARGK